MFLRQQNSLRDAIAAARAEAAHIAEQARADARAVAERGRDRIARARARVDERIGQELAAIDAELRALPDHDEPDERARARLEHAVQSLAAALTGAGQGPHP